MLASIWVSHLKVVHSLTSEEKSQILSIRLAFVMAQPQNIQSRNVAPKIFLVAEKGHSAVADKRWDSILGGPIRFPV